MNIITNKAENVNVYEQGLFELMGKEGDKWSDKHLKALVMSDKLIKIGEINRGIRMKQCGNFVEMEVCPKCGRKHIKRATLCRDRFCPICGWRLSMKRYVKMLKIINGLMKQNKDCEWQFVTLTVKNCKIEELKDTMQEMSRTWNSIASSKPFKRNILGTARSVEITYNQRTKEFHPHYHILTIWKPDFTPSNLIVDKWMSSIRLTVSEKAQCTESIKNLHYTEEKDSEEDIKNAILEVYKYSIKDNELLEMPLKTLKILNFQLKGKRMTSLTGIIKQYAKTIGADNLEELDEDEQEEIVCKDCGSADIIKIVGTWSGTGYAWRRED